MIFIISAVAEKFLNIFRLNYLLLDGVSQDPWKYGWVRIWITIPNFIRIVHEALEYFGPRADCMDTFTAVCLFDGDIIKYNLNVNFVEGGSLWLQGEICCESNTIWKEYEMSSTRKIWHECSCIMLSVPSQGTEPFWRLDI